MSAQISDPARFWLNINARLGTGQRDVLLGLDYVLLDFNSEMRIIRRTQEELFTTTVAREGGRATVVVNGNFYNVSSSGLVDAALGSDPVPRARLPSLVG